MPVCNFFLMSLGEGSQGTHKKFTGGCALQIMKLYFRHCTKKPSKITFIRGEGGVCALAHGHSMPVGNFFLMVLGETSQRTRKIFAGGCALQIMKLYIRHCTKKRSKITFIRVCFFCALAHGRCVPVCNFFLLDPREGPKERTKNLPGLRGPDGEVIFSSLYENTDENHFIFVRFFLCAWAQYAGLQFFSSWIWGRGPKERTKN